MQGRLQIGVLDELAAQGDEEDYGEGQNRSGEEQIHGSHPYAAGPESVLGFVARRLARGMPKRNVLHTWNELAGFTGA